MKRTVSALACGALVLAAGAVAAGAREQATPAPPPGVGG